MNEEHKDRIDKIKQSGQEAMEKRIASFQRVLDRTRTGRASVTLLDGVFVSYYGSSTPLNQVATLQTPDPRTLVISPFDKTLLKDMEKAILMANIGLNPISDGQVIRVNVPPLTQERRKEIAKTVKKSGEEAKVAIRNIRKGLNGELRTLEKDKLISQDQLKDWQQEVQKLTDHHTAKIDELTRQKQERVLSL